MAELGTEGTPTPLEPGGEAASTLTPVSDGVGPMSTNTTSSTNQKTRLLSSYFSLNQIMPRLLAHLLGAKATCILATLIIAI